MAFGSCAKAEVLGLPNDEAAGRLEKGDVGFILEAKLPEKISPALSRLRPLAQLHPQGAFFSGLLVEAAEITPEAEDRRIKKNLLFALALESPSLPVRREAGRKLMLPVLEGEKNFARQVLKLLGNKKNDDETTANLRGACLYRLGRFSRVISLWEGREGGSSWSAALCLLSEWQGEKKKKDDNNSGAKTDKARDFFLGSPVDSAWQWALREFGSGPFTFAEEAAFSGRAAAAHSAFTRSLTYFRVLYSGETEPLWGGGDSSLGDTELFFRYPELTRDLGRAYQASGARKEGIDLFTAWESRTGTGETGLRLRYLLSYYIGRMERFEGALDRSSEAFARALLFAPDSLQADACIWYILSNALTEKPETAPEAFKIYIPLMHSLPYFSDVLDRLSRYLLSRRDWGSLEEIFASLRAKGSGGASCGWILGRAAEEGYIEGGNPETYFRAVFDDGEAPLYYRALCAEKLGLTFTPENAPNPAEGPENLQAGPELEFLQGFFRFGASGLVFPYIRESEARLSLPELRILAAGLGEAGYTDESLNLVTRYMAREDFRAGGVFPLSREDLLLYYPRPFRELIEKYARQADLAPELFFALIRTESYFMSGAVSHVGAVGLSQLMPATAEDMAGRIARQSGPEDPLGNFKAGDALDLKDPEINIRIGTFYLDYLIDLMGSPMTALLAYNGGLGRVRRWRAAETMPEDLFLETVEFEETRAYGRRVLAAAAVYGYLYYGLSVEEVIADIYREPPKTPDMDF